MAPAFRCAARAITLLPRVSWKVIAWRDSRASTARTADIGVTVLKALLKFGRHRSSIRFNAADGIQTLYRGGSRAEIIWTDEEIERFIAKAFELGRPLVVDGLRLAALTGLSPSGFGNTNLGQRRRGSVGQKRRANPVAVSVALRQCPGYLSWISCSRN